MSRSSKSLAIRLAIRSIVVCRLALLIPRQENRKEPLILIYVFVRRTFVRSGGRGDVGPNKKRKPTMYVS
jgi:hypothetical protein